MRSRQSMQIIELENADPKLHRPIFIKVLQFISWRGEIERKYKK